VLLQSYISKARVSSFTFILDTDYIATNAGHVASAPFEMCLKSSNAYAAIKFLRLAKSVDHRFWWFQSPLRAFENELKKNVFGALENLRVGSEEGYDTLERALSLLDMEANEVGEFCRCFRHGALIQKFIRMLPRVDASCLVRNYAASLGLGIQLIDIFND
jgi:activating signal cointegrator complex subunit 3